MPGDDANAEASCSATQTPEALACVSCRSRKLKCDRVKPACSRCVKVNNDCVYPESRRKPAFKRKNVKELEARLAQVEDLLKDVNKPEGDKKRANVALDSIFQKGDFDPEEPIVSGPDGVGPFSDNPEEPVSFSYEAYSFGMIQDIDGDNQLMGLGMSEAPPPFDVIEELHRVFFRSQQQFIPVVHPGRYLKAYHSAPHLRPPMCLQYAIWAMAANGHETYNSYHDIFYRRARQYLEADEMRGHGEHFITVAHAQAWGLVATYEARCMTFTRSSMSASRCVRLVQMMGLHRLDGHETGGEMVPTLTPPEDWTELEERRRIFWGSFCIDSHCSISTGWPPLINNTDVTTHLPSSEEAFNQGKEEKSHPLADVFSGSPYSTFAGAVVICHVFNQILNHVHVRRRGDRPEDFDYGEYWNRHRELDTTLTSVFMFLPERFRLPKNIRDPVAVHTNLNLHASVICLHNAACERADTHRLPSNVKKASQDRLLTAAQEIVNIMKLTSHMKSGYRSPLVALSLYCATSVYVAQSKDDKEPCSISNLEFLVKCMVAIGREHIITRAFLQQAILDIERNGLAAYVKVPPFDMNSFALSPCGHNIPLLARSSVSRHSKLQPPLPGRLPLGRPVGNAYGRHTHDCCPPDASGVEPSSLIWGSGERAADDSTGNNKRRRMKSPEPSTSSRAVDPNNPAAWFVPGWQCRAAASGQSSASQPSASNAGPAVIPSMAQMKLPHRAGSSASSPSATRDTPSTQVGSSMDTPAMSRVETMSGSDSMDVQPPQTNSNADLFAGIENWDMTDRSSVFAQLAEDLTNGGFGAPPEGDIWAMLNDDNNSSWDAGGGSG